MFLSTTVKITYVSHSSTRIYHSSTRITKIVLGLKYAFLKILPNTILIYAVSRILGHLRKMHFEKPHDVTKIAFS